MTTNHNLMEAHASFLAIAKVPGRNDKQELLGGIGETAKAIMIMVFNPFHHFGITKLPVSARDWMDDIETVSDDQIMEALGSSNWKWLKMNNALFSEEQRMVTNNILGDLNEYTMGVQAKTFLKVFPKSFEVLELQLSNDFDPDEWEEGDAAEIKLDGVRCITHEVDRTKGEEPVFISRNGKPLYNIKDYVKAIISDNPDWVFDGEALIFGDFDKSSGTSRRTKNRKADDEDLDLVFFDALTKEEFFSRKCDRPYKERREKLFELLGPRYAKYISTVYWPESLDDLDNFYNKCRENGEEGVITKKVNGLYSFKRNNNWMKMKPVVTGDFRIVGTYEGLKKSTRGKLGGFIVDVNGNECGVGSGFTKAQREHFWSIRNNLPGQICELKYMEITKQGKLRLPRFVKLRPDLDEPHYG